MFSHYPYNFTKHLLKRPGSNFGRLMDKCHRLVPLYPGMTHNEMHESFSSYLHLFWRWGRTIHTPCWHIFGFICTFYHKASQTGLTHPTQDFSRQHLQCGWANIWRNVGKYLKKCWQIFEEMLFISAIWTMLFKLVPKYVVKFYNRQYQPTFSQN
jgi:hypothetical protein